MEETSYKSESKTDSKITLSSTGKKECKASDIEKNWNKDLERRGVFGPKELSWVNRFQNEYTPFIDFGTRNEVIDFIDDLLQFELKKERERIVEKIKKIRKERPKGNNIPFDWGVEDEEEQNKRIGFNQAIDEVINLLTNGE